MPKREWTNEALLLLQSGQTVQVRPRGHSMKGRIDDGALVTISPCQTHELAVGDIVFARILGRRYFHWVLHLVVAIEKGRFLIGNNHGRLDGWVAAEDILGRASPTESP